MLRGRYKRWPLCWQLLQSIGKLLILFIFPTWKKMRTPDTDLSQQLVFGIKEISRTGSCEPVESHHWCYVLGIIKACSEPWIYTLISPLDEWKHFLLQNRRQKVFNRDILRLCRGAWNSEKLIKTPLIYSFIFQFRGANPTKSPSWLRDCLVLLFNFRIWSFK